MFAFHHSRAAFNSLILLLGSEHAFGQSPRLEPACHEERLAMDSIKAEILAYQLGATSEVPGSEIMAVSYWGHIGGSTRQAKSIARRSIFGHSGKFTQSGRGWKFTSWAAAMRSESPSL
ncbi:MULTISPECIES: hypothetical protein [unclassified Roseateles]|uniref:hypothetical protein n=1 Tax=unclassified Roseateles TaxID=2626991 RepID=UPI00114041C9|nr:MULTISPECIES: hypothetical protein [unclassified Roseateles]MBB3283942.1 hypothetical protein [Mitsuaria sp. BK037]